uniref:Uncharacterized protein n=1 Tax=Anguilla anguilla TaxID=7936 RepID=A0A0E9VAF6_ANGAN
MKIYPNQRVHFSYMVVGPSLTSELPNKQYF